MSYGGMHNDLFLVVEYVEESLLMEEEDVEEIFGRKFENIMDESNDFEE